MSELKARKFFEAVPMSKEGFYQPGAFVDGYLKEEADKVITDQKEEIYNLKQSLAAARHEVAKARGKKLSNKYRAKLKGCEIAQVGLLCEEGYKWAN